MLCVALTSTAFNGYDSCTHGQNMSPWNLYIDLAGAECRVALQSYMDSMYDLLEAFCAKGKRRRAALLSSAVSSVLMTRLRNDTSCEIDAAHFDALNGEDTMHLDDSFGGRVDDD